MKIQKNQGNSWRIILGKCVRMMLTEHNFRRFARPLWKLRLELGLVVLQNSLQLQFFGAQHTYKLLLATIYPLQKTLGFPSRSI